MKVTFDYDKNKDIWCLLTKGKSSFNSPLPTGVYKKLVETVGGNPNETSTSTFIDKYLTEHDYNVSKYTILYQSAYDIISDRFRKIAEKVFGMSLDQEITAYLTVNNRCPYDIERKYFFVSISKNSPVSTVMHELWHFYTWYRFGISWEEKIGKAKYNDIKEALTVLINIECKELLPENTQDKGYPQHQELRNKIMELWGKKPDIEFVWNEITV